MSDNAIYGRFLRNSSKQLQAPSPQQSLADSLGPLAFPHNGRLLLAKPPRRKRSLPLCPLLPAIHFPPTAALHRPLREAKGLRKPAETNPYRGAAGFLLAWHKQCHLWCASAPGRGHEHVSGETACRRSSLTEVGRKNELLHTTAARC